VTLPPYLTDAEVADICEGLTQPAAMIRYMRGLGLRVDKKPSGRPLAWRPAAAAPSAQNEAEAAPNVTALRDWAKSRGKRGQKAQG
jgi:hypothetical protein